MLKAALQSAARCMLDGGVVAYPTEAVFGLGCLPSNQAALRRILSLKCRPAAKGLIVIGARAEHLRPLVGRMHTEFEAAIAGLGERPTTWIVPRSWRVSALLSGGRHTVALRLSRHPVAAALCDAIGGAVVSTSANRTGVRAATVARTVRLTLGRELDQIVAEPCGADLRPSRIVDLATGEVLRA
jgi:L-threonylcarbamoyladenylate synthase